MTKNELFEGTCISLSDQGYGVVRQDGKTVFVKNLLPGEKARIKIIKDQKNFSIGIVDRRFSDSPDRRDPSCPYFFKCGGCAFRHLSYPAELKAKHEQLEHLFKTADPDIEVLPVLGSDHPDHYRNKAQFPISVVDGKIISGFYRPHSNTIVDMEECAIQSGPINEVYEWIRHHIPLSSAKELRHIFIRASKKTGQIQVVFIGKRNVGLDGFTKKLVRRFPAIVSVVFNENEGKDNVILGKTGTILYGKDWIEEDCLGLKIMLSYKSFFQINPDMMEKLYGKALELAELEPDDHVVELYSGTGTIGMLAARKAKRVTGVEIVEEAVENAKANAKLNGLENIDFVCQDASLFVHDFSGLCDVVFVDPPRKGLSPQGIEDICALDPKRIVYISCGPRTLARDIERFKEKGYRTKQIQPVDMFSRTTGIENVCVFEKDGRKPGDAAGNREENLPE